MAISRRFLLAGGAGTVGAVGFQAAAAPAADSGCIDLGATPYEVIADDVSEALNNTRKINRAITEHPVGARLVLPAGAVHVQRDMDIEGVHRFAAIRITGPGKRRLTLSGRGTGVTRIVMTGTQSLGETQIIKVGGDLDGGPDRITLCDFSIEHGPEVTEPNVDLRNHQIELNAVLGDVTGAEIRDVFFGACIGDAIRLAGGEGATTSTMLRNTTIRNITMRLDKQRNTPTRCRSGVSFQKGIRDLQLTDFFIEGPKNSPLDMEPTAHAGMDNITIANGTIDNTKGDTWVAASFDGFEDNGNVTSFLTHSRIVNVRVKGGQLQVVSTRGCTIDNVVIEANRKTSDGLDSPLLLIIRENEDLTISNVTILRDKDCHPGPLTVVEHRATSPRRVTILGGTWTTRVAPGVQNSYVDILDTAGTRMSGTRIRVEGTPSVTGIRLRPAREDMAGIHFDGVTIDSPDGLTNGFVFAALNRNMSNIKVTGCTITGAVTNAIAFTAANPWTVDRFPVIQGNDFDRSTNLWSAGQAAANAVFPIIAGNRGGQCTLVGTVAPEGVVAALQGSKYIRQNGNAPELWWKATGTGPVGWQKLA